MICLYTYGGQILKEEIKIKITISNFSVEFEGEGSFLNQHLEDLLSKMSKVPVSLEVTDNNQISSPSSTSNSGQKLSTNDVASKLGVKPKKGLALMWAAITKIAVVDNVETFSVDEVRSEMKTSSFWDKNMINNISQNIKRQAKAGKLLNPTADKYAIPPNDLDALRNKIAS